MKRPDRDRGAAAVEFALVLPILLLLVFGVIEFGRIYSIQSSITAAARNGARVMALTNDPTSASQAAVAAAAPYTISSADVSITPTDCDVTDSPGASTTVTINYPVTLLTGFFGAHLTLTGTGVMRCYG